MVQTAVTRSSVALAAVARGFTVTPLCWPDKDGHCACGQHHSDDSAGKAPLLKEWTKKNNTQTQQGVKEYWTKYPLANAGIVIQPDHFILEADKDHGGLESLAKIQEDHGELPITFKVKSGGGGYHLYFTYHGEYIRNTVNLAGYRGLDLRGIGGQAVAPGSLHKSGKYYEVVYDVEQAPAPEWLLNLAKQNQQMPAAEPSQPGTDGEVIPEGQRNAYLTRLAGSLRRNGASVEEIAAAVRKANLERCRPPLSEAELTMLRSAKTWQPGPLPRPNRDDIRHKFTTQDLLDMKLEPITWLVDRMIPDEGLAILAGKRKLKKSYMVLQIAAAVATGGQIFGRQCKQGKVLYYGLEDGKRRLSQRIKEQGIPGAAPITFEIQIKPLNEGGFVELEADILEAKPILVVIDTLAAAKSGKADENKAGDMADLMNELHSLAQQYHCAIVVVMHQGKLSLGNVGDDIRGSSAIAAASDVNLGLYKNESTNTLKGEGRDFEEFDIKIEFDLTTFQWQLVGDTRDLARQEAEQDILDQLEILVEADAGRIAKEAGKSRINIQKACKRMKLDGKLEARTEGPQKRILYSIKKAIK